MSNNRKETTEPQQVEALSLEQQQELLEKFDIESNQRNPQNFMKYVIYGGLLAFSLFQLYTAIYGQFPAQIQRTVHLGFALTFVFLLFPLRRNFSKSLFPFMIIF